MNRRKFLGLGAALSGLAAGIGAISARASEAVKRGPKLKITRAVNQGKIRELVCYDISLDLWVARWDILAQGEQYHVDSRLQCAEAGERGWKSYEPWLEEMRPVAREVLDQHLRDRGLTFANCMLLPFPDGIQHARYI